MMRSLPAITIHQPYAWAIAAGHKATENRGWSTAYRGRILIHAGSSSAYMDDGVEFFESLGIEIDQSLLTRGAIIASANLYDCVSIKSIPRKKRSHHCFGPFCWLLRSVIPIRPIHMPGKQKLFTVDLSRHLSDSEIQRILD